MLLLNFKYGACTENKETVNDNIIFLISTFAYTKDNIINEKILHYKKTFFLTKQW